MSEKLDNLNKSKGNQKGWGGARPGSGRPKGEKAKLQKEMRKIFNQKIDEHWEELMDCLIRSAARNPQTAQYLIDQRIGKPTQPTEISGEIALPQPILGGSSVRGDSGNEEDKGA